MHELKQTIRFCKSSDGTRIAYATMGGGPLLVMTAHFLIHLEFQLRTPVWGPGSPNTRAGEVKTVLHIED